MASKYSGTASNMAATLITFLESRDAVPSLWYADWGCLVSKIGAAYGLDPLKASCLFAAFSPRKSINRNLIMFKQCLDYGPASVREATHRTQDKAARILDAREPLALFDVRTAPKTRSFALNLVGDFAPVTIDSITAQAAMNDQSIARVPVTLYREIEHAVRLVAAHMHCAPAEAQASIWIEWRASKPNHRGRTLAGDIDPLTLLRSGVTAIPA